VQWTRLPEGNASAAFVQRVASLLGGSEVARVSRPVGSEITGREPRATTKVGRRVSAAAWIGAVAAIVIAVVATFVATRKPNADAGTRPPPNEKSAPVVPEKSVAVLPFKNLSPDKENEFFAGGMHEDVIIKLGRIRDLTVISQPTMLAYRSEAAADVRKIGAELRVATVLMGSVRRAANQVKVTAQLIDARSGAQLWGNDYLRELTDVFSIQAAIAQEIAQALKATLLPREQAQIARRPTENQEAYDLFLRARQLAVADRNWETRRERYELAIDLLDRALAIDRNFADAYALITMAHGHMYRSSRLDPTPARLAKLKASVEAATRVAPDLPETKVARGNLQFFGLDDFGQALVEYRAAQVDLPNDAEVCRRIAYAERRLGRWQETLVSFKRAAELDPRDEATVGSWIQMLTFLRRFPAAQEATARFRQDFPELSARGLTTVFLELEATGDLVTAKKQLRTLDQNPNARLLLAMWDTDRAAVRPLLSEAYLPRLWFLGLPIALPRELSQATLTFLLGDQAATRAHAEAALAELQKLKPSPRLEPSVLMAMAAARVLMGPTDEALADARTAMARIETSDKGDALGMRDFFGQLLIEAGRTDEALDTLRKIFSGPSVRGPQETRHHPVWSRLKDDPRFEEILKSAKAL